MNKRILMPSGIRLNAYNNRTKGKPEKLGNKAYCSKALAVILLL
jgi:hypothetical protein